MSQDKTGGLRSSAVPQHLLSDLDRLQELKQAPIFTWQSVSVVVDRPRFLRCMCWLALGLLAFAGLSFIAKEYSGVWIPVPGFNAWSMPLWALVALVAYMLIVQCIAEFTPPPKQRKVLSSGLGIEPFGSVRVSIWGKAKYALARLAPYRHAWWMTPFVVALGLTPLLFARETLDIEQAPFITIWYGFVYYVPLGLGAVFVPFLVFLYLICFQGRWRRGA